MNPAAPPSKVLFPLPLVLLLLLYLLLLLLLLLIFLFYETTKQKSLLLRPYNRFSLLPSSSSSNPSNPT